MNDTDFLDLGVLDYLGEILPPFEPLTQFGTSLSLFEDVSLGQRYLFKTRCLWSSNTCSFVSLL